MSSIEVLSRTQRIIVRSPSSVQVRDAGIQGLKGDKGDKGDEGESGVSIHLPFRGGGSYFYTNPYGGGVAKSFLQNTLYGIPFYVPEETTFSKIAVATTGSAGASARLGVYEDGGGFPTDPIVDAGSISLVTAGNKIITFSTPILLPKGWYWPSCAPQGANANLWGSVTPNSYLPVLSPYASGFIMGYSRTGVTGVLPDPWGATVTDTISCPIVWLAPQ